MLDRKEVRKHLESIKEIKKSHALYDMHVHPFDVICNGFPCRNDMHCKGVEPEKNTQYAPPTLGNIKISQNSEKKTPQVSPVLREKMALLTARRLYSHTGVKLFSDHMLLSGIDKILLLPVLGSDESEDLQMESLNDMFGGDDRFAFGYCVPNSAVNGEISSKVKNAIQKYNIKAIKIHPNITQIDLSTGQGKERIEWILDAAESTGLKVVIHGGRSPGVKSAEASSYGVLENLQHVDFSITKETVILAHAGTYGHNLPQIEKELLPRMNRLLAQHDNLFVDVSGLEIEVMEAVVQAIDMGRIFFGSDALYSPQWGIAVKLIYVLHKNVRSPEESFIQIASLNPAKHFFKEETPYEAA